MCYGYDKTWVFGGDWNDEKCSETQLAICNDPPSQSTYIWIYKLVSLSMLFVCQHTVEPYNY